MKLFVKYIPLFCISLLTFDVRLVSEILLISAFFIYIFSNRKNIDEFLLALAFFGNPFFIYLGKTLHASTTLFYTIGIPALILYLLIIKKKITSSQLIFISILIVFVALILLQLQRSNYYDYGLYKVTYLSVYLIFYSLIAIAVQLSKYFKLYTFLGYCVLFFSFTFINIELSIIETINFSISNVFGLRGLGENFDAINLPRIASIGFITTIFVGLYGDKRNYSILILSSVFFSIILVLSETKQAIFATILCLILLLSSYHNLNKTLIRFSILGGMMLVIIYFLLKNEIETILSTSRVTDLGSTMERMTHWKHSIQIISQSPIFGVGLGSYGNFYWPHNIFLESWLELGILGFIIIVYLSGIIIKKVLSIFKRNKNLPSITYLITIWALFYLSTAQVSGDIARNFILFIFPLIFYSKTLSKRVDKTLDS